MCYVLVFFIAFCVLGILDFVWLTLLTSSFYKTQFGLLGSATLTGVGGKWWAVVATYALMALGFTLFVFPHLTVEPSLSNLLYGALFGLVVYGVYQGTNYIVFRDWPLVLVAVDLAWGITVYALTSCGVMGVLRVLRHFGIGL